ncbi:MAG TPA: hypothetical protein PJ986_10595 [Gammaproteobacteria bacterium]|nr:hypothetical protein [Gammaproteobacteria bacterium]
MIEISVKVTVDKATRRLDAIAKKQVPYATAVALTRTAKRAHGDATQGILQSFDSPMLQTQRSIFIKPATKYDLTAIVGLKDKAGPRGIPPSKYLRAQITGGKRAPKRFERALIHEGHMPSGMFAVPARRERSDRYGNLPGPVYKAILADLRMVGPRGAKARRYFVIPPGEEAHPGVYRESGVGQFRAAKPVLLFVRTPNYQPRFPLADIVRRSVETHFPREFDSALRRAMQTAR